MTARRNSLAAIRALVLGAAAGLALVSGSRADAREILVFAASSLAGALDEVAAAWTGDPVTIAYAGSAALARQIEAGAPADLFLSANLDWMDRLGERGLTDPAHTRPLLGNRLVLAGPADAVTPQADLAAALDALPVGSSIATGLLEAVPAGIYARQALDATGRLDAFLPRIVQTENVRLALALAARGEVARAIVYRTDALVEPSIAVEVLIPADLHAPIRYPVALLARGTAPGAAAFYDFLGSAPAAEIFARRGFEVLP